MSTLRRKSLTAALLLNLLIPGAGYVYVGRLVTGFSALAILLVLCKLFSYAHIEIYLWIGFQVMMAVDMVMLVNRVNLGDTEPRQNEPSDTTLLALCAAIYGGFVGEIVFVLLATGMNISPGQRFIGLIIAWCVCAVISSVISSSIITYNRNALWSRLPPVINKHRNQILTALFVIGGVLLFMSVLLCAV